MTLDVFWTHDQLQHAVLRFAVDDRSVSQKRTLLREMLGPGNTAFAWLWLWSGDGVNYACIGADSFPPAARYRHVWPAVLAARTLVKVPRGVTCVWIQLHFQCISAGHQQKYACIHKNWERKRCRKIRYTPKRQPNQLSLILSTRQRQRSKHCLDTGSTCHVQWPSGSHSGMWMLTSLVEASHELTLIFRSP